MASTVTVESLSIQIDDSIQYPDILTFESASIQLFAFDYTAINIPQYGNFYLMKLKGGMYVSDCKLNLDKTGKLATDSDVIAVIGTTLILTAQQVYDLANTNPNVALEFYEDTPEGALIVPVADYNTNLNAILVTTSRGLVRIETNE